MIPRFAVKKYVNRAVDSHIWVKTLNRSDLLDAIADLRPRAELNPKNKLHQLACFLLGVAYPKFCFWLDMGTGKTLLSLELLRYWYEIGKLRRAVVLVTSDKAYPTWEKQIKRFEIDLPYTFLEGSSVNKWHAMKEFDSGLVFVHYPGAGAMTTKVVQKGRKNRWKIDKGLVEDFWEDVNAVVLDESTRASNHGSLAFKLVDRCPADIRYALAGRPFGRDPTLLWAQHYLIDRGETLGNTLGMFREAFFTSKPNPWVSKSRQKYIKEFKFDHRKKDQLAELIQHRSITYGAEECIDLPAHIPIIEEVSFAQEAQAYFDRAIEQMIAAKGNMEAVKNIFLRMRQLSSGFLGFKDDETGERAEVEFDENPKFDRLLELLDEMPLDRKGVVFYEYTYSGRKIFNAAKDLGIKPIWLWSGTKDYKRDLRDFEERDDRRLAVVNNKVGAFSLDGLQIANYSFFYESPVSPIDREQAERRLRRQGQSRKVMQYDLITRHSADSKILEFHQEGEALMTALLRNPSMLKWRVKQ